MAIGAGDRIGQYVLCREIGRGGMATVYEAEHVGLGKRVAIKRMHPHLATDVTGASRFLREGRAATQIRSPHVVEVFDVGIHEDVPFLVMELLEGADLATFLRTRKKLLPIEAADLMVPVTSAVHAAHQAGVVHRDLKPGNILLAKKNSSVSPIVLDFGISKLAGDVNQDLTASEVLLGTVHYMSPEQTRGGKKASPGSDQYALGVILFECLTGAKPFAGSTPYAVMHAIVSAEVTPPSALDPSLPPALDEVVLRAMNRDPRERFPSVRALGAALLSWASPDTRARYGREFGVVPSVLASSRPHRSNGRHTLVLIGVALAAGIGLGAFALRSRSEATARTPVPAPTSVVLEPVVPVAVRVPESTAPPTELAPVGTASTPSARSTAVPRATTRSVASVAAPNQRPERGANGALIVE